MDAINRALDGIAPKASDAAKIRQIFGQRAVS